MDEYGTDRNPDPIQVTLGSADYTLVAGGSVDVEIILANPGPSDFFVINLLGIPPGWVDYSGPSAVWVAAGGQERVVLTICPPGTSESLAGSYPGRVYVFGQSAPDKGREIPFLLKVVPPEKPEKNFSLQIEKDKLTAVPGAQIRIPVTLRSFSAATEYLELSVQGVPADWVILPAAVIALPPGEQQIVDLYLQIPEKPEIQAGNYALQISAASQMHPEIHEQAEVRLGIAAFESQGAIGVMLASVQFSAAPGGSFAIPLTIVNRGLAPSTFRLGIEGIPVGWVSTSTPVLSLKPGESREIAMLVRPPLSSATQAGRRKFRILVVSQEAPEQVVRVDCILTLAAFTQFSTGMAPQEVEAGKPVRVVVQNEGNTNQAFHLTLVSLEDRLIFEYLPPEGVVMPGQPAEAQPAAGGPASGNPAVIQVPPGGSSAFRFTARPRKRSWIGTSDSYPYYARVEADHKESPALEGAVVAHGLIPVWVLAIFLILCLWIAFSATFSIFGGRFQANSATQTAVAGTAQVVGATQTIVANQTAAAVAGQQDTDGDGLINQREMEIGTDPNNADTDRDGLLDGEEVFGTGTNPLIPDTDGDGLLDGDEVRRRTNPLNADTDGDGSRDGDEVRIGTDPLRQDTDGDELLDGAEMAPCPDPLNPDTDRDGIVDGRDPNPCDANNPAMTATSIAGQPTASFTPPPAIVPTQTPTLAPIAPTATVPSLPRFPGLILFDSTRDGNPEIYVLDASGQTRRVTSSPSADLQGVWDLNMRRIAFTSNRDGQNEIYIMNADGSNPVNLTNNPADDQQPAWSSDGEWILFASNRDGNYEIYAIRVNTLETRNLTNSPSNDTQPSWIRSRERDLSGDFILFTSDRDGNQEIYRMTSDGSDPINLTMSLSNDQMARGSPDGSLVVFTSDRTGNQDVFEMRINGQMLGNLTNHPASDSGPSWSSDQVWVAFSSDRTGNRDVFILKPGLPDVYDVTNSPASQDQVSDWR